MSNEDLRVTDMAVLQALTAFEVDYWYEVDHNWGRNAHAFYVADGIFAIGDKKMCGPDAVAKFYRWRENRGDRTARHIATNFRLDFRQGARAKFECILSLYAADGKPVLPSRPPIMMADIVSECELGQDGRWRFISHLLTPVFEGGVPATIPED
jgi:hypothetical protein